MIEYNNFTDLITALINGGDNNITADSFRGSMIGNQQIDDIFWTQLLSAMNTENLWLGDEGSKHWFIRETDFKDKDTVLKYITDKADRDFKLEDFLKDNQSHFNSSLQELIEEYNTRILALNDEDGDIPSGYIHDGVEYNFKVQDIKGANAANDYGSNYGRLPIDQQHMKDDIQWVRAWKNIDNKTYAEARQYFNERPDYILPVLNSKHEAQFTADFIFKNCTDEEMVNAKYIVEHCVFPDVNHDGKLNSTDASIIVSWHEPFVDDQTYYLDFYGEGNPLEPAVAADLILDFYAYNSQTIHAENPMCWEYFLYTLRYGEEEDEQKAEAMNKAIAQYAKYYKNRNKFFMNLIMPKYSRRVEVEDLDRNFWVIAQTLSALDAFLFGPENPLKNIFEGIMDEICQLWENALYLWANVAAINAHEYSTIQTLVIPLYNSNLQNYIKYDDLDPSSLLRPGFEVDTIIKRLQNIPAQYPNSNLVVIPEIRSNNYKHNYYAKAEYPYIMLYNNYTKSWTAMELNTQIDLTNGDAFILNYGAIRTNRDQYEFVSTIAGQEDGVYSILIRPEIIINPSFDSTSHTIVLNNITGTTDKVQIKYHDVAAEIMSTNGDTIIPHIVHFDGTNITTTDTPTIVSIDSSKEIQKGFYQGELISYNCDMSLQV